ncbi:hypothetical protein ACOSP7_006637 [Xanthoceras sorbifolium]
MITNCFQHRRFVCWTWDCRWNPAKSEGFTEVQEDDKCICSGEQLRVDELIASSESLATRDYSASGYSSRAGKMDSKLDNSNIEEAESSGRESGYLNYEGNCGLWPIRLKSCFLGSWKEEKDIAC